MSNKEERIRGYNTGMIIKNIGVKILTEFQVASGVIFKTQCH